MFVAPYDRKRTVTMLVGCGAVICLSASAFAEDRSFVENFETLNTDRWFVSNGWTNNSDHGCTWAKQNVTVDNGLLRLALTADARGDREYSCGEIRTVESYHYGVYEVRMRTLALSGTVSAFFTYTGPSENDPWDEVDVEVLGKHPSLVQLNFFKDGEGDNEALVELGFDSSAGMNDYAFDWRPEAISWYVNGELVHEIGTPNGKLPSTPGNIFVSVWNGQGSEMASWLGTFEPRDTPMYVEVDRIAYTAPGAPCQFPESIVCKTKPVGADGFSETRR